MDEQRMLTVPEVAERLGLTVNQVYRRLNRGQIPSVFGGRLGRQYLVGEQALQDYIDAGQPLDLPARDRTMLSVAEVAVLTGFTVETVRKMCYRGTFTFVRGAGLNGHLRIHKESVVNYMSVNTAV